MKSKKKLLTKIACLSLAVVTIVLGGLLSVSAADRPSYIDPDYEEPFSRGYDYQYRTNRIAQGQQLFVHTWRAQGKGIWAMGYLGVTNPLTYRQTRNMKYYGWTTIDVDKNGIYSDYAYIFTWRGGRSPDSGVIGEPNSVFYYPEGDCYYNSYEARIVVHNENNEQWKHDDVTIGTTYCGETETQTDYYSNSVCFNKADTYQVWVQLSFYLDGKIQKLIAQEQWITVMSYEEMNAEAYNKGIAKGYQDGYNSAIDNSDQWSLWAGLNTLILAPITFVNEAFNFYVFGVNVASFIKMVFTLMIVVFVIVVICKLRS